MPFKSSGDVIVGYSLESDPQLSGQSKWAFAKKGRKKFFIKQFLSPVQPSKSDSGSKATFKRRKAAADAFEKRHAKLNDVAKRLVISPNLVLPIKFGWIEGKYTKIFPRIRAVNVRVEDVNKEPIEKKALVMLQLAEALQSLHDSNVVHSDIKWTNILFERVSDGLVPKLIDFDAGYDIGDRPSDPDDITFDAPYAAPEVWKFVESGKSSDGEKISFHSDIFSLGVLFHEISCGSKPLGGKSVYYGKYLLEFSPSISLDNKSIFLELIKSMLEYNPEKRPLISKVISSLSKILGHESDEVEIRVPSSRNPWRRREIKEETTVPRSKIPVSSGLKGMLVRAISFGKTMVTNPKVDDKVVSSKRKTGDIKSSEPRTTIIIDTKDKPSKLKIASSFASEEIEKRSEGKGKMIMSHRPEVVIKSVIKTTSRIEVKSDSKLKTTIKR